jgi:glycosyltransferase involved in cell wall biosynthesis
MLVIYETHPVQYHAPVYQELAKLDVPFRVVYGSDFSVQGYRDAEFQASFAWDTDLLSGYQHTFIATVDQGGAKTYEDSNDAGISESLRKLNPKAVMALGYNHPFDRGVLRSALRQGTAIFLRTEASDEARQRSFLKSKLRDWKLKRLYHRCRSFLFVGTNAKQHYLRLGVDPSKLYFSPYCVSTQSFQLDAESRVRMRTRQRQELGVTANQVVVMFCGKLSERKGVDLLLAAVKRLPENIRCRFFLLYVGEGALRERLTMDAIADPCVPIQITGFKNQGELSPYYHAADMSVLPSISSETWGLVVNESLHHGVPCVVSDKVGCGRDLIVPSQTGSIFSAGNADALADSLKQVLTLINQPELADHCRAQVEQYNSVHAAEGIAAACHDLEGTTKDVGRTGGKAK